MIYTKLRREALRHKKLLSVLTLVWGLTFLEGCASLGDSSIRSTMSRGDLSKTEAGVSGRPAKVPGARSPGEPNYLSNVARGQVSQPGDWLTDTQQPPQFMLVDEGLAAEFGVPVSDESSFATGNQSKFAAAQAVPTRFEVSDVVDSQQPYCASSRGSGWGRPRDEYVCDGGDAGLRARVRNNWSVDGIELEDTVAHYDTLLGEVNIVASNQSCIYSPRFAAVRQVRRVRQNEVHDVAWGSNSYQSPSQHALDEEAAAVKQQITAVRAVGTKIGMNLEQHDRGILIDDVDRPFESRNQLLPYEDMQVVELGRFEVDDGPLLLDGTRAARAWSVVEAPQVTIEAGVALEKKSVRQGQEAIVYSMPEGKPRLRLVKVASQCAAQPGDTVNFTIRFDNVGDELIGNVTILDMLTTRLQFVEQSAECSVDSVFVAEDTGDTLQLRWEITEPLAAGNGGVIRFECLVR